MSNYYAQIDSNNIVYSIVDLHSVETNNLLIAVDSYDLTLLGKQYDSINKVFNVPAQTLSQAKQTKIAQLQQSYYASFTTFQSNATGTLKTYPVDAEAQDNLRDLQNRLIADSNKNSFYFKTIEDGTLINHTRTQFLQLMEDAETFKVQQTQHYDSKVASVNAATDVTTVEAIIW